MARYGMYIDVGRCLGCFGCLVACKNWHGIKAAVGGRRNLIDFVEGTFPAIERWVFPASCMQCDNAPCIPVCPVEANVRRKDGVLTINTEKCIGCGECIEACPYNARYRNPKTEKADGCDFCTDRIDDGQIPYCVVSCSGEAMVFGDLDDLSSKISKLIKSTKAAPLSPQLGTKPKVYYSNLKAKSAFKVEGSLSAWKKSPSSKISKGLL